MALFANRLMPCLLTSPFLSFLFSSSFGFLALYRSTTTLLSRLLHDPSSNSLLRLTMHGENRAGHSSHHQPAQGQPQPPQTAKLIIRPQASPPTHPVAWFVAAFCTLLWVAIILGGLAVLIIYLVFRPRNPRLEISSVTLNGAYIDVGTLNADLTILANFSNPNEKVYVSFSYMQLDLYYQGTMIATQAVEPFEEGRGESVLRTVHMISSQVPLPGKVADALRGGKMGEGLSLELVGSFRTRLDLGSWLHYTYWLHGRCDIFVGGPPNGALQSSRCTTKH
ncbi:unnamed protein product [Musa acuminata subsp. malaccensis]|uniref:(wild Malaysian banana) hypothetical protein n=1 Tax=Musa acuminata subsp. malaccensis TaxID=214687 RepID=A0A804LBP6_MUSAM|nr:PREDICTED: uncharacterized protein LOC103972691 [Musa acuminata subsp. malaccensis]CAG1865609.1 unnamed protein product [Musa acuminata subsp. malaccensis]